MKDVRSLFLVEKLKLNFWTVSKSRGEIRSNMIEIGSLIMGISTRRLSGVVSPNESTHHD